MSDGGGGGGGRGGRGGGGGNELCEVNDTVSRDWISAPFRLFTLRKMSQKNSTKRKGNGKDERDAMCRWEHKYKLDRDV